jgi:membrane protein implicated in regulation of membrane protease activity
MTIGIIGICLLVALVALFLVWRTVKVFVKLALVGFIALALIAALVWWNYSGGTTATPNANRPAANTRRNTNR